MHQFERFDLLVGNKRDNLTNKTVLVIGLGGVGSYALEALVRSGIGHLILVDNDVINITNLNRQLMALHSNIGKLKTEVLKERINDINPACKVTLISEFITSDNIDKLFNYEINYVVDACDTILTKLELIKKCVHKNIPLIVALGTANKFDPSKLKITTLDKTNYDPLAKKLRKLVRENNIKKKITVVCSDEQAISLNGKLGSTAFVPSTAGLLCASHVVRELLESGEDDE